MSVRFPVIVRSRLAFSQYHPELTPSLSCPMVTRLRGLSRAATSTVKMSVKARSNLPPSKNTYMGPGGERHIICVM